MPDRVGRYEILLPIASGGMATVYLARLRGQRGFEQDVALKLTHAHLQDSKEFVLDLAEEAKLAARIRHRNVVSIIDVGEDPLGVYLVMEYVEGDSLAGLRRRCDDLLPRRIATRILVDALSGLQAAHELRDDDGNPLALVHRDFSPANILIGTDGVARLADFGVAKAANRLDNTVAGVVKGKIAYMSPEQARGEVIDRRSDVWAAGVVAWESFTGRRLYTGDHVGLLFRVATETPPRLRSIVSTFPSELDDVVARALEVDRSRRWPTAAVFAHELTAVCRAAQELAEVDEVAAHVTAAVGSKLSKRRAAVKKVLHLREQVGDVVMTAETTAKTPSSAPRELADSDPPVSKPPEDTVAAVVTVQVTAPVTFPGPSAPTVDNAPSSTDKYELALGRRRRSRRLSIAAVIGVGLVGIAAALGLANRRNHAVVAGAASSTAPAPAPTNSSDSTALVATAVVAPPTAPLPTATTPSSPAMTSLRFLANARIATLRVGGNAVPIDRPVADLTVPVPADVARAGTSVEAIADDGRQASLHLSPGAGATRIVFPPRATAAPQGPSRPPPLAGDPYHSNR